MHDAPKPGENETCDTVGVLATAVSVIASIETTEAVKILSRRNSDLNRSLVTIDIWSGMWKSLQLNKDKDCPLCAHGRYDFLDETASSKTVSLCGRNSIQITPGEKIVISFDDIARRLEAIGAVTRNEHLMKFSADGAVITLFQDGRAIIKGVKDEAAARTIFSKYIGL
jgi:adenylyltransferase/sulfurtransferase